MIQEMTRYAITSTQNALASSVLAKQPIFLIDVEVHPWSDAQLLAFVMYTSPYYTE